MTRSAYDARTSSVPDLRMQRMLLFSTERWQGGSCRGQAAAVSLPQHTYL